MNDDAMQPRDGMTGDGAEAGAKRRRRSKPVYDQAFFLKLARPSDDTNEARTEARERWNEWQRQPANTHRIVTFEGVDFRTEENRGISFDGFEFGGPTWFTGAAFGDMARFAGATFRREVRFVNATFDGGSRFIDVAFHGNADFCGAFFGKYSNFDSSKFYDVAQFDCSLFIGVAVFENISFCKTVRFEDAVFDGTADFIGASFISFSICSGATFCADTYFDGAVFGGVTDFAGKKGDGDIALRQKAWSKLGKVESAKLERSYRARRDGGGIGPATFADVSFFGAHFRSEVSFARRAFEHWAGFADVRFDRPPDFDGATDLQRIDFTGARAGFSPADRSWWMPDWTTDSSVAVRLRALRSHIEATKNHDFERDLYIEERKAERGIHLARLWDNLRPRRLIETALAYVGGLPRLPKIDIFAEQGEPVVRWPEPPRNRRGDARPAMIGDGPAAVRLRRAYRRNGARFLAALGPLLGHLLWIAVMAVYWALSDYGRSWLRPALCLGVVLVLFHGLGPVDGITARALGAKRVEIVAAAETARPGSGGEVGSAWDEAAKLYAVANSIPFVGPLTIDGEVKKFLFCGAPPPVPAAGETASKPCIPLPPAALQAATIVQNLLSILLVFFIGLALRNYFRLK